MSRLADYVVIVGYDYANDRGGESCGRIIQRFPEQDWHNCPFTQGIEMFCQPVGWRLTSDKMRPTFFVSVLTDIDGDRHYCACLTFYEDVEVEVDAVDDDPSSLADLGLAARSERMYAPKTLVVVSRLDCFDVFRNCLGLIYTVHIENMAVELATLIGNMIGCIHVPPAGGPQVRFSIGAGDRQALQPPLHPTLPVTHTAVAMLFSQLGTANTMAVFCAAQCDQKVLFHSESLTRLTDASHALTALMYPLKYSYVYIPLLPTGLLEVLSTPTPFIAGVPTCLLPQHSDLLDVIVADLDGGSIFVPEHIHISLMPEPYLSHIVKALNLVLNPELLEADNAFPLTPPKPVPLELQDKEIRAIFLRFFAELLIGYRSCLTISRIHPEPFITFHTANFLGHRGLVEDEFTTRLIESMSFNTFVSQRGPPYRACDIFDEVFASAQDMLRTEENNPDRLLHNIRDLAHQLYLNENPNLQPYVQKVQKPPEGSHSRVHQLPFPYIDRQRVAEIIDEGIAKQAMKAKVSCVRVPQPRVVPSGAHIRSVLEAGPVVSVTARRLEVLSNCINFIFENKITDARKIFAAVLRALKSRVARQALVEELGFHVESNRAVLQHLQFDLVVRLLNCALQNDSPMDENGIAAAILPLSTSFCRKLCTGVLQFAYTCIQEHAVWANQQFWEATFHLDVQTQIRQLYVVDCGHEGAPHDTYWASSTLKDARGDFGSGWSRDSWRPSGAALEQRRRSTLASRSQQMSALEIAAEQMRTWPSVEPASRRDELISNEESTVYCQAIHYSNRMVYLRVPLDASKCSGRGGGGYGGGEENASSTVTNSVGESDSFDAESGFDEQEATEVGAGVIRFVTRFVDKVCCDNGVTDGHIRSLHQMIPGVVAMHIETLEAVHRESKRLPPIAKPKILTPVLMPGEEIVIDGLRVYLLSDGREDGTGGATGGPMLLPAEGAVFLTTYRIIFKGTPCELQASELVVCRSFPISTLTREKRITVQYLAHLDLWLHEGLQLRSSTFQLLKLAFDEEVSAEDAEMLRKLAVKLRYPDSVLHTFAFSGAVIAQPKHAKHKEKNASLKGFAKRTLMKTARKAGLKKESSSRKHKYIMPTPPMSRRGGFPPLEGGRDSRPASIYCEEELSTIEEQEIALAIETDAKDLDRLAERCYCRDYHRLGLGSLGGATLPTARGRHLPYRLTLANTRHTVCRSYPAVLVVPQSISDESIRKFSRSHRQYRFPVVTWRHSRTKAVLLRASGFHGKGVMGLLKTHHNTPTGFHGKGVMGLLKTHHSTPTATADAVSEMSSSVEQEKYFSAIVAAMPARDIAASTAADTQRVATPSPSSSPGGAGSRRSIARTVGSLRTSRPRPASARAGSLLRSEALRFGTLPLGGATVNGTLERGVTSSAGGSARHELGSATLYVFGEKSQMKGIKMEAMSECDFIPVDYHEVRQVKASFKKLMRACVPSALPPTSDPDKGGFLRAVQDSDWLPQLQNILLIGGATVDLMDGHGASVMLCLEDGWDFTTQVSSVAQLLLDPFYRTLDGFQRLVEKEWLSFGHRFTHRSSQTAATHASGFAPLFIQFLDVVHQVHAQFPLAFQFSEFYLRFLAYHCVSNRFRTFLLDSESERVAAGWLLDAARQHGRPRGADAPPGTPAPPGGGALEDDAPLPATGVSVWDYISQLRRTSTVFQNFYYAPSDTDPVLRPNSHVSSLSVWSYYVTENLAYGPSYDLEVIGQEVRSEEERLLVDGPLVPSLRRTVNGCYDNVQQHLPDSFTALLQELHSLHQELDCTACAGPSWSLLWDKLDAPSRAPPRPRPTPRREPTLRRSTLELVARGHQLSRVSGGGAGRLFSQAHRFEKFSYSTPAYCDYCSHVLWGLVKTGMRCADCGYNSHEKCLTHVPKNCTRATCLSDSELGGAALVCVSLADTSAVAGENRTHEGYLYKRGALLKGWKQRWFVFDSMKHQLRYYDSAEEAMTCKGFIDLSEVVSVVSVMPLKNVQGVPKKADDDAFFEMRTVRRVYNFLAANKTSAHEWIDKIHGCIQ